MRWTLSEGTLISIFYSTVEHTAVAVNFLILIVSDPTSKVSTVTTLTVTTFVCGLVRKDGLN